MNQSTEKVGCVLASTSEVTLNDYQYTVYIIIVINNINIIIIERVEFIKGEPVIEKL